VEKAMFLFFIMGALEVVLRSSSKGSELLIFFDEYGIPFLLFVAAKTLFHSAADIKKLVGALFLLGLYLALHGTYQFLAYGDLATAYESGPETLGHLLEGRAVGPFSNSAFYGGILTYAFGWTLYLFRSERWAHAKLFIIIGLGMIGLAIFFSLSRAVWVSFLVSLFLVQVFDRKWRKPFALCLGALLLLSFFFVSFRGSEPSRFKERFGAADTIHQRLASYRATILMILAKPFVGYGRGDDPFFTGRAEFLAKVDSPWVGAAADMGPPHNQYLYMLVQYGLVGLVLYGAIVFNIIRSGASLMRMFPDSESAQRQFVICFWGMLAAYLVQGLFADVAAFPFLGALLYVFAGVVDRLRLEVLLLNRGTVQV
jgi:O-antigen ligase